jgi:excisionase family DNA binding protein
MCALALKEARRLGLKMKRRTPTPKKLPAILPAELESDVMTVPEVAQYLNCHTTTINRLLEHRQIPAFRVGADWRFLRSEIEKWIAAGGGQPSGSAPPKTAGGRRGRKPKPKATKS